MWHILELSAMMTIEVQKFLVHLVQPGILYGVVKLVYLVVQHLTVGIYIVVVLAMVLAVLLVLHLSYEKAEVDALEEEAGEEERAASMLGGTHASGYSGLELSDRMAATHLSAASAASPASPGGRRRRPSFDSEDGDYDDEHGGSASLLAALKAEVREKAMTLHSTSLANVPASALKDGSAQKVMNIRSLMATSESKLVDSPKKPGLSLLERQLDLQDRLDEREFLGSSLAAPAPSGTGGKGSGLLGRLRGAEDSLGGQESIRGAESVGKKPGRGYFDHEHEDVRFSRTSHEIEKELATKLAQSKQGLDRYDTRGKPAAQYNSRQLSPSLRGDLRERGAEDSSLGALLQTHGTPLGGSAAYDQGQGLQMRTPAKGTPFRRR